MKKNQRIVYIDYLKVMGLFLVILAHVNCPRYIMQIRNFDVPLLVVLSGYLASKTFIPGKPLKYYWKRIQRLIFPSWIFLAVFFVVQTIAYSTPSLVDVFKGLTFQKDANMVGMLWVIWVYFICALLIPIIYKMGCGMKSNIAVILSLLIFEAFCFFTNIEENRIIYITVLTIIPWGALTYLGFYFDKISSRQKVLLAFTNGLIYITSVICLFKKNGSIVLTSEYKYPARIYYLSYAVPIIILFMRKLKDSNLKANKFISFVSGSSLWIYLWHILLLYVIKSVITNDHLWLLQYVFILGFSILVTFVQNIVVKFLMNKFNWNFLKVFLG